MKALLFLDPFLSTLPKCPANLHVAVIVKRGKIIEIATNRVASRSRGGSSRGYTIHAEKAVVLRTKKTDLRGSDMYVMRIAANGECPEFRFSQPCKECTVLLTKCMREYGLRNVYFTTDDMM